MTYSMNEKSQEEKFEWMIGKLSSMSWFFNTRKIIYLEIIEFQEKKAQKSSKTHFVGIVKEFIQSSEKMFKVEVTFDSDLCIGQMIRIVPIVWPEYIMRRFFVWHFIISSAVGFEGMNAPHVCRKRLWSNFFASKSHAIELQSLSLDFMLK